MHVVIVDGDISYPPNSGKRLRTLNLMQRLARRHQVGYICRGDAHSDEAHQAKSYLEQQGIETVVVHHPVARKSGVAFYARLAANLFSWVPYNVASHISQRMKAAVTDYAANHQVDLWQVEWTPYLLSLPDAPGTRKLLISHNVDSLIWQRMVETERNPLKRWYIKQQWRKFDRFEKWTFKKASRIVAVSDEDALIMREQFGAVHVDVVENGIDRDFFANAQGVRDARKILFLGSLEWRPNLDAVDLLLSDIFPKVLAQQPQARLCIVGRNPPPSLIRRVQTMSQVELHANVADVRPFLASSGMMAVPLRIGGGSRLKILEALATGLPVVSTSIGAEGLCLQPNRDLMIADGETAMAEALCQCIANPAPALQMAANARRFVLDHYDWDALANKLEEVWEKCLAHRIKPIEWKCA